MIYKSALLAALECCDSKFNSQAPSCHKCPYFSYNREDGMTRCHSELVHDTLVWMKSQQERVLTMRGVTLRMSMLKGDSPQEAENRLDELLDRNGINLVAWEESEVSEGDSPYPQGEFEL